MKLALTGFCLGALATCLYYSPWLTLLAAGSFGYILWQWVDYRRKRVVELAERVVRTFTLTNDPCIDHIRALCKAFIIWKPL